MLNGASLEGAILAHADLAGANLTRASLVRADLRDADFRAARLTDSRLDGADLTGAKLWETQRTAWSIEGVTCRRAFWDSDDRQPTEYGEGEFERAFAERPRLALHYPGGLSPVDLAMLPLIAQRLQAEHPGCALRLRSVQDDGNGAVATIAVEDLANRGGTAFATPLGALRRDLAALRQRLQQEEKLRLGFEAQYRAVARDALAMLLDEPPPRQEIDTGRLAAPMVDDGAAAGRSTDIAREQAGAFAADGNAPIHN